MGIDEIVKNLQKDLKQINDASGLLKTFGESFGKSLDNILNSNEFSEADKQKVKDAISQNTVPYNDLEGVIKAAKESIKNI
jgi:hypothetical protein